MSGFYLIIGLFMFIGSIVGGRLKSIMNKFSQIRTARGLSGGQVAKAMLQDHGIYDVKIKEGKGFLTDHYNPKTKTISLSPAIMRGQSIAAAAVAAHECGHAIQHNTNYQWLQLRSNLVPLVSLSSKFSMFIIGAGILMATQGGGGFLLNIGIAFFAFSSLFALVTLPVEYDASNRAVAWLDDTDVLNDGEISGAKTALKWAARTYVVAAIASVAQLLYLIMISRRR